MIIWGGFDGTNWLNTGGRYDPTADAWTATDTSSVDLPSGRSLHTAVWTGTEMIVWGGTLSFNIFANDGGKYNPLTGSWTAISTTGAHSTAFSHGSLDRLNNGYLGR